jgi:hypothetical protein
MSVFFINVTFTFLDLPGDNYKSILAIACYYWFNSIQKIAITDPSRSLIDDVLQGAE